jgi:hypothetical protein
MESNMMAFNGEENIYKKGDFVNGQNHIWNMGAYLIYNNSSEIITYRISNPYNFLWLLRILNKEVTIELDQDFIEQNKKFLEEVTKELTSV